MTNADLIFGSAMAAGTFFLLFIVYFTESAQHRIRAAKLEIQLKQADARARAESHKANMARNTTEQANGRANLLKTHNKELEDENEILHDRVMQLSAMMADSDEMELVRMAVMDGPITLVPRETINLN